MTDPNSERPAPFGKRYEVHGRSLQTYRTGAADGDGDLSAGAGATVVLLPGGGSVGLDMWRVQEGVAQFATVVSYDRGGTGWSSRDVTLPRTLAEVTGELRNLLELLRAEGVSGPYIIVGHSLGGLYARYFATQHPEQVAALVLIEPGHEDLRKYMPKELTDLWDGFDPDAVLPDEIHEVPQEIRDFYRGLFQDAMAQFPAEIREPLVANHVHRAWLRGGIQESSNVKALGEEMRAVADAVPDVPTVLLTAMDIDPFKRAVIAGMSEELVAAETAGKLRLYDEVAASFTHGENRRVEGVGHVTLVMQRPDAVVDAVRDLMGLSRPAR
ncbi:alpha/beta hydrolase fold protein [Catenulispora acidiphila DSM 44928]|uniref:Alpha/beta hydrolase fold protein n=1 Tax=Catenulispora acidiphila (strain DSM 44928 / JCM 14897 / NBRC 102108 / NRRL B-24433 / ID139908) TaxID=479433 RepID=C7QGQ9_CATAD|nr:alpha/beta hydrolase [Catenulispora acidiphila]ACU74939.1 alpha/beta hydrolase fold protein [Catenulispora acidiphila DSM 44928]